MQRSSSNGGTPTRLTVSWTPTATTPSTQSAGASGSKHAAVSHPHSTSPNRALAHFTAADRTLGALGLVRPGFLPWRSWAAQAAIRAGQGEQAAGLIADELVLRSLTELGTALPGDGLS